MKIEIVNGVETVLLQNQLYFKASEDKIIQIERMLLENPNAILWVDPIGLHSSGQSFPLEKLELLRNMKIKRLLIQQKYKTTDLSELYHHTELEELDLTDCPDVNIDFKYFPNLKHISMFWNAKIDNLFSCNALETIHIWKYKSEDKTLRRFEQFKYLKDLKIVQSNIENLKGIEKLKLLKKLSFINCSKLKIKSKVLNDVMDSIQELHIQACKNVGLDFLSTFPELKKLKLVKHSPIPKLFPILDQLKHLESIFIGETLIEESDNYYYNNYKNIRDFFFDERKHHKLKLKDIGVKFR